MSLIHEKHSEVLQICFRLSKRNTKNSHELLLKIGEEWVKRIEALHDAILEKSPCSDKALKFTLELGETALGLIEFQKNSLNWLKQHYGNLNSSH